MILEQAHDPVSARWNKEKNTWDVGRRIKYRWTDNSKNPQSDWFYEFTDALDWIKEHDKRIGSVGKA